MPVPVPVSVPVPVPMPVHVLVPKLTAMMPNPPECPAPGNDDDDDGGGGDPVGDCPPGGVVTKSCSGVRDPDPDPDKPPPLLFLHPPPPPPPSFGEMGGDVMEQFGDGMFRAAGGEMMCAELNEHSVDVCCESMSVSCVLLFLFVTDTGDGVWRWWRWWWLCLLLLLLLLSLLLLSPFPAAVATTPTPAVVASSPPSPPSAVVRKVVVVIGTPEWAAAVFGAEGPGLEEVLVGEKPVKAVKVEEVVVVVDGGKAAVAETMAGLCGL